MPTKPKTFHPAHNTVGTAYEPHRASPTKRGYGRHWEKVRKMFLAEHPLCEDCAAQGLTTPATEVHHIKPLRGHPELHYAPENLAALCKMCHNRRREKQ